MKKIFAALLALSMICGLLSVVAYGEKNDAKVTVKGVSENTSDIGYVVYPSDANELIKQYAEVFAERLSELTGNEIISTDSPGLISHTARYSVYIGEPYEEDIDAYIAELEAANGGLLPFMPASEEEWEKYCGYRDAYSLEVENSDIHIKASDEYVLYCAIKDFLNEVKNSETYVLENGYKYVTPDDHVFKSPYTAVDTGSASFHAAEAVAILPVEYMPFVDAMQGGAYDGKFAYYCGTDSNHSRIFKYYLNTWELEEVSEPVYSRHSNSITYLPETDLLMISHCQDDENNSMGVSYVNASTLEETLDTILPVRASRLEYRKDREKYYILKSETVSVLDKDLNILSQQPSGDSRGTPQGCCCDEKYLYDIRWDVDDGERLYDHTVIYELDTMEYKFSAEIKGMDEELEPENIIYDDTVFYIGYHHVKYGNFELGTIYRFVLLPDIWWAD